jgi:hypothetical protein
MLYQVDLGYACFGVIVKHKVVTEVAPIAHWMIGKPWKEVKQWIKTKAGSIQRCNTRS